MRAENNSKADNSCEYSAARPIKQASGPIRTFTPLGDTWHIFVFKVSHHATRLPCNDGADRDSTDIEPFWNHSA